VIAESCSISVAVTGLSRGENPQAGASVISSLRQRFPRVRIVGLSYDPLESSHYSEDEDRLDAAYLLPYPESGSEAVLKRFDVILGKEPIDVLIPCLDSELPNFIALRGDFLERGIKCILPGARSFARRSKENLQDLGRRRDIPVPATTASFDPADLAQFVRKIGYPAYLKGRFYDAHLVWSPEQLFHEFSELMRVWGGPVLAQQVIKGEEYDVVGLGDGRGAIIGSCSIRKLLRSKSGKAFGGVVVADPALDELSQRVIRALRWDGPFELEFLKAPGLPHTLFEMNPRFPAWVGFPSKIGCNLPARLLERILKLEPSPLHECQPGQMFIRHSVDLVGDISDLARLTSAGERDFKRPEAMSP
jgi:carbamoyl-phosphate synthase large subunit